VVDTVSEHLPPNEIWAHLAVLVAEIAVGIKALKEMLG
jgi:hypothetical protein